MNSLMSQNKVASMEVHSLDARTLHSVRPQRPDSSLSHDTYVAKLKLLEWSAIKRGDTPVMKHFQTDEPLDWT